MGSSAPTRRWALDLTWPVASPSARGPSWARGRSSFRAARSAHGLSWQPAPRSSMTSPTAPASAASPLGRSTTPDPRQAVTYYRDVKASSDGAGSVAAPAARRANPAQVLEAIRSVVQGEASLHAPEFAGNERAYVLDTIDSGWVS